MPHAQRLMRLSFGLALAVAGVLGVATSGLPGSVQAGSLGQLVPVTAGPCTPTSTLFVANMTGNQEVPPTGSAATGTAIIQLQPDGQTLVAQVTTQNLPLDQVILAHIHSPAPPGVNAPVRVNLFLGPQGTFTNPFTGTMFPPAPPDVLNDMRNGQAYFNVHTVQFPGGEIRGQIGCPLPTPIPLAPARTATPTPVVPTVPNNVTLIAQNIVRDGTFGVPAASLIGQVAQISGGLTGTARVTGSMAVTVTAPAGIIPAGAVGNVFFSTTLPTIGIENIACPPAVAGVPTTCTGNTIGNILQNSTARLFVGGVQVATGIVVGPGGLNPQSLLPPPPPIVLPPPPPPVIPLPPGGPAAPVAPSGPEAMAGPMGPMGPMGPGGPSMPMAQPSATPMPQPAPAPAPSSTGGAGAGAPGNTGGAPAGTGGPPAGVPTSGTSPLLPTVIAVPTAPPVGTPTTSSVPLAPDDSSGVMSEPPANPSSSVAPPTTPSSPPAVTSSSPGDPVLAVPGDEQ